MRRYLALGTSVLVFGWNSLASSATPPSLDIEQIHHAATKARSLFLDDAQRIGAVDTFLKLVRIKGPSGQEQSVRDEVERALTLAGAAALPARDKDLAGPCNLVMEIPGSGGLARQPCILLNAHLDTLERSTPELLAFDAGTGDFCHSDEADAGKPSSFGGDDRSGVAVIVEAIRHLQGDYWSRGVAHRRVLLVFTAGEERGCLGAKYLSQREPNLFAAVEAGVSIDGPLDFRSDYPRTSFVAVVSESDSKIMPYQHVLGLMQEFCERSGARFGRTETGLGMGDFAHFPPSARSALHLRSPVRGFHNKERVNVQDLVSHIDLLCYLLLGWDHSLPAKLSPETLSATFGQAADD